MRKGLITVTQTARLFNVSPQTIKRWDKAGKLVAKRNPMNNYRFYREVEIKKLIEKMER